MKNIVIIMLFALALTSCSKYDENPAISLSSKDSRLCQNWLCTEVIIGGVSTSTNNWWISLNYNKNGTVESGASFQPNTHTQPWSWNNDKTIIVGQVGNMSGEDSLVIVKLTKKELWVTNSNYEYKFKSQ